MQSKLSKEAKRFKKTADKLLFKEGLFDFLKKYGEVLIIGAYDFDLMMHGDVDLYVINKDFNRERVVEIFTKILKKLDFRGYLFFDHVKHRSRDIYPYGYAIGLRKTVNAEKWNFDIWFLKEKLKDKEDYHNKIKSMLNTENRETILKFKKYRRDNNLEIWGTDIYDAVLNHKITDLKEFKEFIKDKIK